MPPFAISFASCARFWNHRPLHSSLKTASMSKKTLRPTAPSASIANRKFPMTLQETLETVRRVEIRTNRLVNDMMVGAYLSHFKGRGMDFEELREYMPGDDVRSIDWNVTNRMGRPFVKRFREERELGVILAVDVSASSAFGSTRRSKRESAVEIA